MKTLQRLSIAKSTIAGAGFGLFVAKGAQPFKPRETIVRYTGDSLQTRFEISRSVKSDFTKSVKSDFTFAISRTL
jgi:hypothetical protein